MGRARSPNYPAISLPDAIAKIRQVYNAEHRNRLSREAIAKVLGYEGLTGASQPVISALTKYNLLEGRGDSIRVSDDAVAILVDRKGSSERVEAAKRTASSPKIFEELDKQFEKTPSEETARIFLEKRGFTQDAANRCAANYRDTREFVIAETGGYTTSDGDGNGDGAGPIQVGDRVQWESQGAHQFPEPRRVVGLSDDGKWVFVEGTPAGLPREQVTVEEPMDEPTAGSGAEGGDSPPANPFLKPHDGKNDRDRAGVKRAVLPLDEGEAVFEWPDSIGREGAADIDEWLTLLVNKVRRSAGLEEKKARRSAPPGEEKETATADDEQFD